MIAVDMETSGRGWPGRTPDSWRTTRHAKQPVRFPSGRLIVRCSNKFLCRAECVAALAGGHALAGMTALRAGEVASLSPSSFDLSSDEPTVTVAAAYSKRRRKDVRPIKSDLAIRVRAYLDDESLRARGAARYEGGRGIGPVPARRSRARPRPSHGNARPCGGFCWPICWPFAGHRIIANRRFRTDLLAIL
jgi:hypothetical protein